ncbi:MAG: MBL fold metallo-hydrolase [Gemmatimonadales bacterium]|nr:MBL fold metallo-hydrolase [Gemmatimonadales bacterium]
MTMQTAILLIKIVASGAPQGLASAARDAEAPRTAASADSLSIVFLANAGVLIEAGARKVLVDALYGEGLNYLRMVTPSVRERLEKALPPFDGAALILATHTHRDHFNAEAVAGYLRASPTTSFISTPEAAEAVSALQPPIAAGRIHASAPADSNYLAGSAPGVTVRVLGLPHGPTSVPARNVGFLIAIGGFTVLHIGDTRVDAALLGRLTAPAVDLAFIPYWYFLDPAGEEAVVRALPGAQIVLMHVPPTESDYVKSRGGWHTLLSGIRTRHPNVTDFGAELERRTVRKSP